ncbi:MAG: SIS domain-containing protein, partial [Clostridia bacterium]|nr:SIS domain-containing protein [Clostridia bacterium]
MNSIDSFRKNLARVLDEVFDLERANIEAAATAAAKTLANGGMIYTFGTGHAHILAEEIFYRAGGLVKVYPIFDEKLMLHISASESSQWERKEDLTR